MYGNLKEYSSTIKSFPSLDLTEATFPENFISDPFFVLAFNFNVSNAKNI